MSDRLWLHCLDHSFRRRWTFEARPILRRIVFLLPGMLLSTELEEKSRIKSLVLRAWTFGLVGGVSSDDASDVSGVADALLDVSQKM